MPWTHGSLVASTKAFLCSHYNLDWHNSPGSTQVCHSQAFFKLHRYPCDCITTSTTTWILYISVHARDLPKELLPGKKILLFLPKVCFAVSKEIAEI